MIMETQRGLVLLTMKALIVRHGQWKQCMGHDLASNVYGKNIDDAVDDNALRERFSEFGNIISAKGACSTGSLYMLQLPKEKRKDEHSCALHILSSWQDLRLLVIHLFTMLLLVLLHKLLQDRVSCTILWAQPCMESRWICCSIKINVTSDANSSNTKDFKATKTKWMSDEWKYDAPIWTCQLIHASFAASEPFSKQCRFDNSAGVPRFDLAAKITGMLFEMDDSELLPLLESPESLAPNVGEAVQVLEVSNEKVDGQETIQST
ncbi:Poly-adenylate binding protein, unique domain [Musa troglodytarum]|uniref:Poly-adenylate binding protein, unique domain n=1 Tax=Musa troglodytarum TaxID=320322 RepID=A0A9E7L0S5_9LILI|nr:Poly-adenylate binding protein, unique domain [Musa troglodytarum]